MENEVFNLNRFWRYLKSEFDSFVSRYGISLLVMSTMAVTTEAFNGLISLIVAGEWQGVVEPVRYVLYGIFGMIVLITSPAKLYGHLTDRKEGSAFLMIPVSRLEKFISMVLITCVVVPFIFNMVYLGLDILVCKIDPTCGTSMFSRLFLTDLEPLLAMGGEELQEWSQYLSGIASAATPFLYFDDLFQISLVFLLGALIFKTSKTGKTLGCLILLGLSLEMLLAPVFALSFFDKFRVLAESDFSGFTLESFRDTFPFISWVGRHLALVDTLWDTLLNCLVLFLVWLRLKKMKH
ncbi:MAG: hypothetical protein IK006_04035 [Bacteroidaceae bacterium]|nr:hypothetical protein [Bacteroidaceae bacterium]